MFLTKHILVRDTGAAAALVCMPLALVALSTFCGCASVRVTDPARTASEQFLLSQAAIEAVEPLPFDAIKGRNVFVDETYFAPAEKEFVLAELRAKLLLSGVMVVAERSRAEIILEVRSGGVGIDRYENLLGIPSIATPSLGATAAVGAPAPTILTPELAITKEIRQVSFASIAYVAYWADTGEVVASSGPHIGKAYREDWWFFGFGPRTIGSIPPVRRNVE